jgi:two-component system, sensor histidine kinase and response regulator
MAVIDAASAGEEGFEQLCRSLSSRYRGAVPVLATVPTGELEAVQQVAIEWCLSAVYPTPVRASLLVDGVVRALVCAVQNPPEPEQAAVVRPVQTARGGAFQPDRFAAEKTKLERLLARNSLDAKRQFEKFCLQIPGGRCEKELKALQVCMEKLDFKKARQLLSIFPAAH